MYDIAIIGCGVVGAATAYTLAQYRLRIAVVEAHNDVANETSKANSAIIHAGYDAPEGTKMAALNVAGNAMAQTICEKLDVPFQRIGSLVLAFDKADMAHLNTLYARGRANGVPGLQLLDAGQVKQMEPHVSDDVCGALYAPSAGIINPWDYTLAMAQTAVRNGAELFLDAPVTAVRKNEDGAFVLITPKGEIRARRVINAAGVYADQVHELIGEKEFTITPSRGEYYLLDKAEGTRVSHTIFQCPNALGKGVLVSPTVHGNLIVGPNATPAPRSDTSTTADGLAFVKASAQKSVPDINFRENIRTFAGVRANHTEDDFIIAQSKSVPGFYNLAGIKSPGLSAAPAIAQACAALLEADGVPLQKKAAFCDERRVVRFHALSDAEKNELIARDARYGRVVCRCETITEGEIVAALHSPIPPVSINGVKRRCNAGMGRCQSGFCGPRVQEIIARELGISQLAVTQDEAGSWVLCGETKGESGV